MLLYASYVSDETWRIAVLLHAVVLDSCLWSLCSYTTPLLFVTPGYPEPLTRSHLLTLTCNSSSVARLLPTWLTMHTQFTAHTHT